LCPPELDKSGGDGDHSEQNDQPAEIAMDSAHGRHCFLRRRNGEQDVHGREIGKIKQTDGQQSQGDQPKADLRGRGSFAGTDQSTAPYGIDGDRDDQEIDGGHEGN
jgi:hypothetical protein